MTGLKSLARHRNSSRERLSEAPVCPRQVSRTAFDLAERVRSILTTRDLSLHRLSQITEKLYGRRSGYFVPHNLYSDLRLSSSTPSIYQLFALSRISGYRLGDWLAVFGFQLEDLARLQILLPSNRTVVLDSSLDDPNSWVPWLGNKGNRSLAHPASPLADFLEFTHRRRLESLSEITHRGFLYAKIGREDALAFPNLLPGSIVRINTKIDTRAIRTSHRAASNEIFLIQHSKGHFCCQLRIIADNVIVPVSAKLPYAQIELQIPQQAKVLGVVDLEIRATSGLEQPVVPTDLSKQWIPGPIARELRLANLLRHARIRLNLSLRDVSSTSRRIADSFGDDRYFISQSSLSDYEVLDTPPRHFHKAMSLCILYGLRFREFLGTIGMDLADTGTESMPDYFLSRHSPPALPEVPGGAPLAPGGFLGELLKECQEIPIFLRNALGQFSGLPRVSLNDLFWIRGEPTALNPYLINGLLVLVNRRKRKPMYFGSKPLWQQPVYVILKRDGTYLCACCGIENGTLIVHPYSREFYRPIQLRYHHDAEIVGQIVAIARKLS